MFNTLSGFMLNFKKRTLLKYTSELVQEAVLNMLRAGFFKGSQYLRHTYLPVTDW